MGIGGYFFLKVKGLFNRNLEELGKSRDVELIHECGGIEVPIYFVRPSNIKPSRKGELEEELEK